MCGVLGDVVALRGIVSPEDVEVMEMFWHWRCDSSWRCDGSWRCYGSWKCVWLFEMLCLIDDVMAHGVVMTVLRVLYNNTFFNTRNTI